MEFTYKEALDQITLFFDGKEEIDSATIEPTLLRCCVVYGIITSVKVPVMVKLA